MIIKDLITIFEYVIKIIKLQYFILVADVLIKENLWNFKDGIKLIFLPFLIFTFLSLNIFIRQIYIIEKEKCLIEKKIK